MSYYVIIRGPLGVGKSTVSKRLARMLRAEYISVDRVLDDRGIWYSGRLREFLEANEIVAQQAGRLLADGTPVVVDGNFYWKSQIKDLERRLAHRHLVFALKAPLEVCIQRDASRAAPHGSRAAGEVYAKSTRFSYGTPIDATQPVEGVVRKVRSIISRNRRAGARDRGSAS